MNFFISALQSETWNLAKIKIDWSPLYFYQKC